MTFQAASYRVGGFNEAVLRRQGLEGCRKRIVVRCRRLLWVGPGHRSGPVIRMSDVWPVTKSGGVGRVLVWMLLLGLGVESGLAQGPGRLTGLLPLTVDHRPLQSPVKNQAGRGTCIAFSVAAMMETFDGVPSDLSEQGAYGYIKLKDMGRGEVSAGGLLGHYPELLTEVGFMHESMAPYDPKAGLWSGNDSLLKQYLEEGKTGIADLVKRAGTTRYAAEAADVIFLKDDEARDVGRIKQLLASGHRAVAVGYISLYTPYWGKYKSGLITPSEGYLYAVGDQAYTYPVAQALRPGLVDEVVSGKVKVRQAKPENPGHYGGHAVTAVGYTTEGFIIKNSWGSGWGMEGYAVVSFDYHRMFCDEALAVKKASVQVRAPSRGGRPAIYLKSRPNGIGTNAHLRMSLFAPREGGLPAMRNLRYEVYEQAADGGRGKLVAFPPPSLTTQVGTGHPVDVLNGVSDGGIGSDRMYWVQVTFASEGESIERIVTFPNVTWANREYRGH